MNALTSKDIKANGSCAGKEAPGGVAPLGHGKREGPAGDKLLRSNDAGYGGRVRSGAQRNGAPREPPSRHGGKISTSPAVPHTPGYMR